MENPETPLLSERDLFPEEKGRTRMHERAYALVVHQRLTLDEAGSLMDLSPKQVGLLLKQHAGPCWKQDRRHPHPTAEDLERRRQAHGLVVESGDTPQSAAAVMGMRASEVVALLVRHAGEGWEAARQEIIERKRRACLALESQRPRQELLRRLVIEEGMKLEEAAAQANVSQTTASRTLLSSVGRNWRQIQKREILLQGIEKRLQAASAHLADERLKDFPAILASILRTSEAAPLENAVQDFLDLAYDVRRLAKATRLRDEAKDRPPSTRTKRARTQGESA